MAILKECKSCKRKGGFALSADDDTCARCMKQAKPESKVAEVKKVSKKK